MTLHIICVAYQRVLPLCGLITSFRVQSNSNWRLHIIHDGKTPEEIRDVIKFHRDKRIEFVETSKVYGQWGHPNRRRSLELLQADSNDYVLMTNDDNYYVPSFVEIFLEKCLSDVGFVYCNTVHSYMAYDVLVTQVKQGSIDMGSFIVRYDVAKEVGFKYMYEQADGGYAEKCAKYCISHKLRIIRINKPLFVHN